MDFNPDSQLSVLESLAAMNAARQELEDTSHETALASTAGEVCRRLQSVFDAFMTSLKPDEEIGVALASFGVVHQISVETVRAVGPNLLQIDGDENGRSVSLVQHVSQLSFLLVPLKVSSLEEKPRRIIGFQVD